MNEEEMKSALTKVFEYLSKDAVGKNGIELLQVAEAMADIASAYAQLTQS